MSSFKSLNKSDLILVPYTANKQWAFTSSSLSGSSLITIYHGKNSPNPFNPNQSSTSSYGEYQTLLFKSINHLFYQTYTSSLNTSSLGKSLFYESASQNRPTQSYFIYNENQGFIKNYPTGINDTIKILSVNQDIYGSKILPKSFYISSSDYQLRDDGRGNIFIGSDHAGNIFYSHGLVIVTNQLYQTLFDPTPLFSSSGDFSIDFSSDFYV